MHVLIALALIAAAFTSAKAEDARILVQNPPVYMEGESYTGKMVLDAGKIVGSGTLEVELPLKQQAVQVGNRGIYVKMSVSVAGMELMSMFFDPRTFQSYEAQIKADGTLGDLVAGESSCSARDIYPIILGKEYRCTATRTVGEKVSIGRERFSFDTIETDNDKIIGYCGIEEAETDEGVATAHICMSPDGKWMKSMEVTSVRKQQKI